MLTDKTILSEEQQYFSNIP